VILPPLRTRIDDLEHLVDAHLAIFSKAAGKNAKRISEEGMKEMRKHDWPGNLRELRNVLERAVILSSGEEIQTVDLLEPIRQPLGDPGGRQGGTHHHRRGAHQTRHRIHENDSGSRPRAGS
jgi:DNA-binding NtrC family response regulator